MTDRLDALVVREYTDRDGNKKSTFTKIGAAFATRNGGWSIALDALPLPQMGERGLETRILLMPPKQDDRPARQDSVRRDRDDPRTQASRVHAPLDDEVPF